MNPNTRLAKDILFSLKEQGVSEFCVCPAARNAPLVTAVVANPHLFKVYYFFEERCAAFFALGRVKTTGNPVGIITTSGTAAGELLPAVMESHYSGLPLVLITADRPQYYRGSGAPQAAEHLGIYGVYASKTLDLCPGQKFTLSRSLLKSSLHINPCFDEPLLEPDLKDSLSSYLLPEVLTEVSRSRGGDNPSFNNNVNNNVQSPVGALSELEIHSLTSKINPFLDSVQRPLAIVGGVSAEARTSVVQLLKRWGIPTFCEALSGLREEPELASVRVAGMAQIVERALHSNDPASYPIDGVIRIGSIPTHRFWRDLEIKLSHLPVLSLSPLPFSGLGRASSLITGPLHELCKKMLEEVERRGLRLEKQAMELIERDRVWQYQVEKLLEEEPESEPGMIAALSRQIPQSSRVYLGNSLPIREWDLAASKDAKGLDLWGSKGLNGIDGQISTFLGFSTPATENWAIFGDLTTLYDLPGPWILPQLPNLLVRIVIVNNGGGKIFSRMFPLQEFQNKHDIEFKSWADLWKISYQKHTKIPPQFQFNSLHEIIELVPSEEATQRFWQKYSSL
jgi:2-succinyl-5-enolpyruvyl-6-hydroxy-3-cyclohexene-1-carboxylate synthase